MRPADAVRFLEVLADEVQHAAAAGRGHGQLAGRGLRHLDQLTRIGHRQVLPGQDCARRIREQNDRLELRQRVEGAVLEQRRAHGERAGRTDADRIAIGRRLRHGIERHEAARARPVLRDEGLTQSLGQRLAHGAPNDVHRASRCEWDDEAHRFCGIALPHRAQGQQHRCDQYE
jgi:hypothetical protein